MANQTGRPIAPARKLVAWIIGTIAFFVIALGLGMSSSPVAFFGLAVLAIAIAVAFMPVQRRGGRATVAGNAEVRSITPPPVAGAYGRATIQMIVVAPGLGAFETTVREPRVPVEKWPEPGATVPITVDVDDTRRVRVSWRDAPSSRGGDDLPPPPPPAARAETDDLDDEVFGDVDEAPWQGRQDDWNVEAEPVSPSAGSRGASTGYARTATPVVVRDTPTGTIVEGHVVDHDEEPAPLPRRAGSAHRFDQDSADPEEPAQPSSRPEPDPDPDDDPPGSAWRSPDAAPHDSTPHGSAPHAPEPHGSASHGSASHGSASAEASGGPTETVTHSAPAPTAVMTEADPDPGPAGGSRSPSASAAGRPPGSRPSPRPRSGSATATFETDPSAGTAQASPTATTTTATAQAATTVPPAQRTPSDPRTDPAADIDLDLDGPPTAPTAGPTTTAAAAAPAAPRPEQQSPDDRRSTSAEPGPATDPDADPVSPAGRRAPADPVSPAGRYSPAESVFAADPVSPAGRRAPADSESDFTADRRSAADPVSPAGRRAPIDPVSPAGGYRTGTGRVPGPPPPPPPVARPTDAPAPPPPPVARSSQAAAPPPPPPSRATRADSGTREQQIWARPPQATPPPPTTTQPAPTAQPTPTPRHTSADQPAPTPRPASTAQPAPAPRPTSATQPAPATRPTSATQPAPRPASAAQPAPEPWQTSTGQSAPSPRQASAPFPAPAPRPTSMPQPAPEPRPASTDDRWAPPTGQAAVPPNVEARPLGSRTRFFMQPGDEPTIAEDPRPRPERTPSSSAAAPSPVSAPPAAPQPDRPFPSAPPPATTQPAASRPGIDQIDIPLGPDFQIRNHDLPIAGNPEPAPETRPQAAAARADGIIAPPVSDQRQATEPRPTGEQRPAGQPRSAGEPRPGNDQPTGEPEMPRPSALRDGILGVAVGRAAVSPDAFPTPHLDDVPAPGEEQRRGGPWGDLNTRPDEHAGDVITGYPSARPAAAGSIHGVGITVLVTDLERSTEFYRDILGFHEIDNGDGSAVLASGDTRLVLRTVHNLSAEAGRLIYLNLEVGDIEAVHSELREKGVKFVHSPRPVNRGDKLELWSATFRDPDNHNIAITQWRAIH